MVFTVSLNPLILQNSAPKMTLTSLNVPSGKTTDLVIGEQFTGQNSGAVAIVVESLTILK